MEVSLAFRQEALSQPINPADESIVRFSVSSGDNARTIATNLQTAGLIADPDLFVDYARAQGLDVQLEIGKYFLTRAMSTREIAHALTDSRFSQIQFTIIPGWRIEEVAESISNNRLFDFSGEDFMNVIGRGAQVNPAFAERVGLPPGMSLEGFLLPDTYTLDPDITALELRDLLLDAFINATTDIYQQGLEQGLSLYEITTIAAIIQREALRSNEHPLIASVYRNRLATPGWRLDADPTVQYVLGEPGNWWPRITQADYRTQGSYISYTIIGLPPGPIASPSLSALSAAANPETSPYYFFRADCRNDGYHDFAITYEEHLANGC